MVKKELVGTASGCLSIQTATRSRTSSGTRSRRIAREADGPRASGLQTALCGFNQRCGRQKPCANAAARVRCRAGSGPWASAARASSPAASRSSRPGASSRRRRASSRNGGRRSRAGGCRTSRAPPRKRRGRRPRRAPAGASPRGRARSSTTPRGG